MTGWRNTITALEQRSGSSDAWRRLARPEQLPPDGDWLAWYIEAGRGWGKTRTGAEWLVEVSEVLPRVAIVAESFGEARDTCVEGESGIKTLYPAVRFNRSLGELFFPSGCIGKVFSADDPDSLRGPNNYAAWCDEIAKWRYLKATWDNLMMTMRKGERPRTVITTTPRPLPLLRTIKAMPSTVVTKGRTYDNIANLSPAFIETIVKPYEGTTYGRRELEGEDLDDVEGALWTRAMIDAAQLAGPLPDMRRVVVAIDPAVTSGEDSDETGIIVAGAGVDGQGYILADRSCRLSPDGWARRAIAAFHEYRADRVVAEVNNGGDLVEAVIKTVEHVPYTKVSASRGKRTRAEPIAALYEQGRVKHAAPMADLEDQLCSWTPDSGNSPDRLDALVWALTELGIAGGSTGAYL